MASMLSPTMSDQDLFSAMVTHYEPRIHACMISANAESTFLTKLQSLENLKDQYRTPRRDFEHQDHTWTRRVARLVIAQGIADRMAVCKCATLGVTTVIEILGTIH